MTDQEIIDIRKEQERIYQALNKKYETTKDTKEPFTFWLTQKNNKLEYQCRFNRGKEDKKKPYTSIGIVQYGTRSFVQLLSFECEADFKQISFGFDNRNEIQDQEYFIAFSSKKGIIITQDQIQSFYDYLSHQLKTQTIINISGMADDEIANNLYKIYLDVFGAIKTYDKQNQTDFYGILKIPKVVFERKRENSEKKMVETLQRIKTPSETPLTKQPLDTLQQGKDSQKNKLPLNLILYGPPGTGKTYNTVNRALEIILKEEEKEKLKEEAENAAAEVDTISISDDYEKQLAKEKAKRKVFTDKFKDLKKDGRIEFTTFHQSMSYEDFVEGIKPITKGTDVTYDVMPGIFKQICEKAKHDKGNNYVLIIDEINRGNVSQIFGELITLIEKDKRLGNEEELTVKLPYSSTCKKSTTKEQEKREGKDTEFGVPNNLYIIGTMNTADRSVEALDTALRRRFSFEEMMPKYKDKEALGIERVIEIGGEKFKLSTILKTINQRIEVLKGREQQIGHSYLMKCKDDKDLKRALKDKVVPLLQEYFYGDYSQIGLVLGPEFVEKVKTSEIKFHKDFESPRLNEVYHLPTDEEWEQMNLNKALHQMGVPPCSNSLADNTNQAGDPQIEQEETKTEDSKEEQPENLS